MKILGFGKILHPASVFWSTYCTSSVYLFFQGLDLNWRNKEKTLRAASLSSGLGGSVPTACQEVAGRGLLQVERAGLCPPATERECSPGTTLPETFCSMEAERGGLSFDLGREAVTRPG